MREQVLPNLSPIMQSRNPITEGKLNDFSSFTILPHCLALTEPSNPSVQITLTAIESLPNLQIPERHIALTRQKPILHIGRASVRDGGRLPARDNVWINSAVISREHASLRFDPDQKQVWLQDIGSLHGSFQNGVRLVPHQPKQIHQSDVLRFGAPIDNGKQTFLPYIVKVRRIEHRSKSPPIIEVPGESDDDASLGESSIQYSSHILREHGLIPNSAKQTLHSPMIDLTAIEECSPSIAVSPSVATNKLEPPSAAFFVEDADRPRNIDPAGKPQTSEEARSIGQCKDSAVFSEPDNTSATPRGREYGAQDNEHTSAACQLAPDYLSGCSGTAASSSPKAASSAAILVAGTRSRYSGMGLQPAKVVEGFPGEGRKPDQADETDMSNYPRYNTSCNRPSNPLAEDSIKPVEDGQKLPPMPSITAMTNMASGAVFEKYPIEDDSDSRQSSGMPNSRPIVGGDLSIAKAHTDDAGTNSQADHLNTTLKSQITRKPIDAISIKPKHDNGNRSTTTVKSPVRFLNSPSGCKPQGISDVFGGDDRSKKSTADPVQLLLHPSQDEDAGTVPMPESPLQGNPRGACRECLDSGPSNVPESSQHSMRPVKFAEDSQKPTNEAIRRMQISSIISSSGDISRKRKASDISKCAPTEDEINENQTMTLDCGDSEPISSLSKATCSATAEIDKRPEDSKPRKRIYRVAEAFGYVALGGVAAISALIATAPAL